MSMIGRCTRFYPIICFFFFNNPPTTEIYTLPLHAALPISLSSLTRRRIACASASRRRIAWGSSASRCCTAFGSDSYRSEAARSEEHTSELQSRQYLVCRLLLEKKKR